MVATIVEAGGKLCGIISEGDLRRAILAGKMLDTPLSQVMNTRPITLKLEDLDSHSKITGAVDWLYRCYGTGQGQQAAIPVVDDENHLLGLVTAEMLQMGARSREYPPNVKLSGQHVLVVGGAGYIGSVLVRRLLSAGWRVRVLYNLLYRQASLEGIDNERFSFMRADVTNINDAVESIAGIDAVVYLAEIVGDPACALRPERALKTNYLSVANMAHLCAYLNINRFIYASSYSVYGGSCSPEGLLSEESALNPLSYYGQMKTMSEQVLRGISAPLFSPTILRLATVFGCSFRPRFDLVVNAFAKNAFFNHCLEVFGGSQWRPNVHVGDVADAVVSVLEAPAEKVSRQIFNVGSNKENYTIDQLAEIALAVFPGTKIKRGSNSVDLRNYRVDFGKIEGALGYQAKTTVRDGLAELKSAFQKAAVDNSGYEKYSNLEALKEFVRD